VLVTVGEGLYRVGALKLHLLAVGASSTLAVAPASARCTGLDGGKAAVLQSVLEGRSSGLSAAHTMPDGNRRKDTHASTGEPQPEGRTVHRPVYDLLEKFRALALVVDDDSTDDA
jgi:hypothetical protein